MHSPKRNGKGNLWKCISTFAFLATRNPTTPISGHQKSDPTHFWPPEIRPTPSDLTPPKRYDTILTGEFPDLSSEGLEAKRLWLNCDFVMLISITIFVFMICVVSSQVPPSERSADTYMDCHLGAIPCQRSLQVAPVGREQQQG